MHKSILKIAATLLLLSVVGVPFAHAVPTYAMEQSQQSDKKNAEAKLISGGIELTAGTAEERILIYSIAGNLVKDITLRPGSESVIIELKAGCYVVRGTDWSKKLIVR